MYLGDHGFISKIFENLHQKQFISHFATAFRMELTTNVTRILKKRHANYVSAFMFDECNHVLDLPVDQQCEYVTRTRSCKALEFKINCATFIFCTLDGREYAHSIPVLLLIVLGICLVYLLNLFITKFFVDTSLAIGRMFQFNEYVTGVTVIAVANTLYNFYFTFYSNHQTSGVVYNATMGTALLDFGILIPIIILLKPHKIIKHYVLIDVIFVILNYIWLYVYYTEHEISYLKSISLALVYVLYIIILWIDSRILRWQLTFDFLSKYKMAELTYAKMPFKIFSNANNKNVYTEAEDKLMVKARRFAEWFDPGKRGPANQYIFKQFKDDLFEFQFAGLTIFYKIKNVIDIPFLVLFRFVMPVIDFSKPCHKWSKLLRVINVITFPFACWIAMSLPLKNYIYLFYATLILAVLVFFTSRTDRAPEYYPLYGLCAFFGYTFITFGIMSEVENIISAMFMLMNFGIETTAHLAIAFFDVIPDISLAINLVQRGYPKVAWAACFASVIFRGFFEMGIRLILRLSFGDSHELKSGAMGPTGAIYGVIQLLFLCFGLKSTNFFARRALAYFMIITYVTFMFYSILVDCGMAHGYGTDHLNEGTIVEDSWTLGANSTIPKTT